MASSPIRLLVCAAVGLALGLAGCGRGRQTFELSPQICRLECRGASLTLKPLCRDRQNRQIEITGKVSWATSNAKVVTVNDGLVTAVDSGTATITATTQSFVAIAAVTVQVPATLALEPTDVTLAPGGYVKLLPVAMDTAGYAMTPTSLVWKSAKPAIAEVTAGTVMAKARGQTQVTASIGGIAAAANITVRSTGKTPRP